MKKKIVETIKYYENNEKEQWMYKESSGNKNNTREGSLKYGHMHLISKP